MNTRHTRRPRTRPAPIEAREPDQWVTGGQPMTDAQARYLRLLCEEAGAAFEANLTKAQAAKRIDQLRTHPGHRAA